MVSFYSLTWLSQSPCIVRRKQQLCLALCLSLAGHAFATEPIDSQAEAELAFVNAMAASSEAEAELFFERALMFNPDHAEVRMQFAILLAKRGKLDMARGLIQSLIADPRTPALHRTRLAGLIAQIDSDRLIAQGEASDKSGVPALVADTPPQLMARVAFGYSSNPYSRADINSLTLTLSEGSVDLPVSQNLHATPLVMTSLSYIAPNHCGFEVDDQRWGGSEQFIANKLLLSCNVSIPGEAGKVFASSWRSNNGSKLVAIGFSWSRQLWRISTQLFTESQLERRGYTVRLEHLVPSANGGRTFLSAEAEKAVAGAPGSVRASVLREYALTSSLSLRAQLTLQRDQGAYSALLDYGASRKLALVELALGKNWGIHHGWNVSSSAQVGRRWSNLQLFNYKDLTFQVALQRVF